MLHVLSDTVRRVSESKVRGNRRVARSGNARRANGDEEVDIHGKKDEQIIRKNRCSALYSLLSCLAFSIPAIFFVCHFPAVLHSLSPCRVYGCACPCSPRISLSDAASCE